MGAGDSASCALPIKCPTRSNPSFAFAHVLNAVRSSFLKPELIAVRPGPFPQSRYWAEQFG